MVVYDPSGGDELVSPHCSSLRLSVSLVKDLLVQVDVGNFLRFKACVLYTELDNVNKPLIHIEVVANVTQPEIRSSEVSFMIKIFLSLHHLFAVIIFFNYKWIVH